MPGVNDRRSRPTIPFNSQELARRSEEDAGLIEELELEVELVVELVDPPSSHPHVVPQETSRLASGTTPPGGFRVVAQASPPPEIRARTSTVHDPLTTSVLAEVARRAQTIELDAPIRPDVDDETDFGSLSVPDKRTAGPR